MTTEVVSIEGVRDRYLSLVDRAGVVEVTDKDTADAAGRMLMQLRKAVEEIDEARFAITRPLDQAKSNAMEQAKQAKRPYEEAIEHVNGEILGWTVRERKRIAAEEAEAEARRAELEVSSIRAAEDGNYVEAEELLTERDATVVTEKAHRAAGTTLQMRWKAECFDLQSLILAVASGDAPVELLQVNQSALDARAREKKVEGVFIPGVRFKANPVLASTARA